MSSTLNIQSVNELVSDMTSFAHFMYKPADFMVTRRLAPPINTLQFYIDSFDATKSAADTYIATIPSIVNDAINNTAVEGGVLADTFVTATANAAGSVARTQRDVNSDTVTLRDFGAHPSNPDNSQFIQNAFDWSASTGRQVLGVTGDVYTLGTRTFPLAGRVLTLNGDFDFDGRGCTFKIADNFGDYYALIWRIKGDTRIKNLIVDENTTNNPIANLPQTNEQNFRTAMFLWGEKNNNTCEVSNIQFRDWCGIWQVTTTNFKYGFVKNCTLFATTMPIKWIDRTSMYIGIHGAEISGNKMHGNATSTVATTPIECHASGQHIHSNYAIGYRNSIYIVNDSQDTYTAITQDVIVESNQFLNTAQGICIWQSFPLRGMKNIKIRDNTVRINSHLLTGAHSYPAEYGIGTLYGGWLNLMLEDIEILDNNIEFIHHEGEIDSTVAYGIQLNCYPATTYRGRNIKIKGNTIKNAFSHGIALDFLDTNNADSFLQGIEVSDNIVIDAGRVVASTYAVVVRNTKNMLACKIHNNTAIKTGSQSSMVQAVGIFSGINRGELESKGNRLLTTYSKSTFLYNFGANQQVRQTKDFISIKPMTVDLPTHYAESGSTIIESNTGLMFEQVGVGVGNNWVIKATAATEAVGAYVPKGTEITNTNPASDIAKWVALTAGYALFDWKASTAYKLNDGVYSNGQVFKCTQAGTSGTTAIGWSVDEIIDGTAKWVMLPDPIATWKAHYIKATA